MNPERISEIIEAARERYSERLRLHGPGVLALGWSTQAHQEIRFAAAASLIQGKSILDVGCGLGDLLTYLCETGRRPDSYQGIDILPEFVAEAGRRHKNEERVCFSEGNIFDSGLDTYADTVVALGLLNYRLKSEEENYAYVARFLEAAFRLAQRCVIFDGISKYRTADYQEENFIFYANPARVIEIAARLSPDFVLLHDLPPIPQREYIFCVRKW
jgi:SAM-dependent methyltransferase